MPTTERQQTITRIASDCSTGGDTGQPEAVWYSFALFKVEEDPMGVDAELLRILACPECKTPVALVHDESALKCATCNRVYPIKDDIPVMLIDEATIEP
jgi:uncharacterized protein YbaR (Trm112 family)